VIFRRLFFVPMLACGSSTPTTAHIDPVGSLPDAATVIEASAPIDDAWHGEGCRTIASRTEPIQIAKVALSGGLYDGRTHCYLDLPKPLCFQWASDAGTGDAGMEQVEVESLRIAGGCSGAEGTAEFRGKLSNPIVSVRRHGWAIEVDSSSMTRLKLTAHIADIAEKPTNGVELERRFLQCWTQPTATASLTLTIGLSPERRPIDVRRQSGSGLPAEAEQCVIEVVRNVAFFDLGPSKTITLPITFARTQSPM